MKLTKIAMCLLATFLCLADANGQETSLDLRKDGRVIAGRRKDYFLRQVKLNQIKLSQNLHDKFVAGTIIGAIVVPPGKTGDRFLIGVIIGSATLPDDWTVIEGDFQILRDYSTNKQLASVEEKSQEVRSAMSTGNGESVSAKVGELKVLVAGSGKESGSAASYAGYLLSDLDSTSEFSKFSDLVTNYRNQEARSVRGGTSGASFWADFPTNFRSTFYTIDETDTPIKVGDLRSSVVERQLGARPDIPDYLMVWQGRTLVIIPEKPGEPFTSTKYGGDVSKYLIANSYSLAGPRKLHF